MIDITVLDKVTVLQALYNNAEPLGLGRMAYIPGNISYQDAKRIFDEAPANDKYFDYVHGRVMKVHLDKDAFNPGLYDRDNGEGAAQRAVDSLRVQTGV